MFKKAKKQRRLRDLRTMAHEKNEKGFPCVAFATISRNNLVEKNEENKDTGEHRTRAETLRRKQTPPEIQIRSIQRIKVFSHYFFLALFSIIVNINYFFTKNIDDDNSTGNKDA